MILTTHANMIFLTFTIYPDSITIFLIVMIFWYFSFEVCFVIIKSDVVMMICKTRVKPFDVLIQNRMTIMTSVDRATQLVDECQVKRRKG